MKIRITSDTYPGLEIGDVLEVVGRNRPHKFYLADTTDAELFIIQEAHCEEVIEDGPKMEKS